MSAIVGILNCFNPGTGRNVAQVVLFEDGTVGFRNDESIGRATLRRLRAADSRPVPEAIADHVRVHPQEHDRTHRVMHPE